METDGIKCGVCAEASPKYKCPKCLLRTCSLPCVKKHKSQQSCSGVRDKTAYVSLKNFKDLNLLNDYRFLEDAVRKTESAQRDHNTRRQHIPFKLQKLIQACEKREIKLKHMPPSFTRRKENDSYYHIKEDEISWRVEWIFPQASAKYANSVSENTILSDIVGGFLEPSGASAELYHLLKPYRKQENLTYFMKMEQRPANSVRYYKLDSAESLKTNLKGKLIIEFPTIFVVLGDKGSDYRVLGESDSEDSSESDSDSDSSESDSDSDSSESDDSSSDSQMEETTQDEKTPVEPPWNKLLRPNFGKDCEMRGPKDKDKCELIS